MISKIIQKKILNKELIIRKLPLNYNKNDYSLFNKDLKYEARNTYIYFFFGEFEIFPNGILNQIKNIFTKNYCSINGISKFKLIKIIFLYTNYFIDFSKNLIKKKKYKIIEFDKVLILYDRHTHGYYHWVNDFLIKLDTIKNLNYIIDYIIILPSIYNLKFIKDSLKLLGAKYYILKANQKIRAKQIMLVPELSLSGNPRPKSLKNFVYNIKKKISLKKKFTKKIYISRKKSQRRKLTNEVEFEKYLKARGFKIVFAEDLNFEDQIKIFHNAKIVIGLYGAGLVNCMWMKKNSLLIELRPDKEKYANCFLSTCNILKIKYMYYLCKKDNFFMSVTSSNFKLDIKNFDKNFSRFIK